MATPTVTPQGWYGDPADRHEHRYWDGARWTALVADGGATGEDVLTGPPGALAPPAIPTGAGARGATGQPPSRAYRAFTVRPWRVVVVLLAGIALELTLLFEVVASIAAAGSSATSTDQFLWATSWLYQPPHLSSTAGPGAVIELHYGYPPLVLWAALILALAFLARIPRPSQWALKKAGARATFRWSVPEQRRRLRANLHELGGSKRYVFDTHQRGRLIGGGIASLVVVLVSAYAMVERSGAMLGGGSAGKIVSDLSVGLGPTVCLIVGLLGVVASVASWPWTPQREVLIRADGSVEEAPPTPRG
jgi:hypothetical protein